MLHIKEKGTQHLEVVEEDDMSPMQEQHFEEVMEQQQQHDDVNPVDKFKDEQAIDEFI